MFHHQPAAAVVRRPRPTFLALLIAALIVASAVVVVVRVPGRRSMISFSQQTGSPATGAWARRHQVAGPATRRHDLRVSPKVPGEVPERLPARGLGTADGQVADGTTAFTDVPAVVNLDPALLAALRRAATEAAADGVELDVNSGWRSRAYQERLFDEALAKYGSESSAEQWVARPGTSVHEAGDAVDVGPASAAAWLANHGVTFGLCEIYGNEPWHFELRHDAADHGCPAPYADPTHDPRTQR